MGALRVEIRALQYLSPIVGGPHLMTTSVVQEKGFTLPACQQ